MFRLFIHAPNVHQGGGAVLLTELLCSAPQGVSVIAVLDERMDLPEDLSAGVLVQRVRPTLARRLTAEIRLAKDVQADDYVLCFGNLPPLFRLRGRVSVFLQNRYLVEPCQSLAVLPLRLQLRLIMERTWLISRRANATRYFVQTASMQQLVKARLGVGAECFAFVQENVRQASSPACVSAAPCFDFIYVASGEAHKNHLVLLDAWKILAEDGLFPSLALTLSFDATPDLVLHIERESALQSLCIHNLGLLPHDRVIELYREVRALIYPSDFESFGLPLIEARQAGLPVLAPELDYVRDVVDPEESFDPRSPVSIARAVRRFLLGRRSSPVLKGARQFLACLVSGETE